MALYNECEELTGYSLEELYLGKDGIESFNKIFKEKSLSELFEEKDFQGVKNYILNKGFNRDEKLFSKMKWSINQLQENINSSSDKYFIEKWNKILVQSRFVYSYMLIYKDLKTPIIN